MKKQAHHKQHQHDQSMTESLLQGLKNITDQTITMTKELEQDQDLQNSENSVLDGLFKIAIGAN